MFVTILTQAFFAFVGRHFGTFPFFTVRHSSEIDLGLFFNEILFSHRIPKGNYFTLQAKLFAGLNAGMLCAGIVIVVPFEMLRATF